MVGKTKRLTCASKCDPGTHDSVNLGLLDPSGATNRERRRHIIFFLTDLPKTGNEEESCWVQERFQASCENTAMVKEGDDAGLMAT